MSPEELVEQLNRALPGKLRSAVLYGSAAAGDFVAGTSNYNVLVVVDGLGVAELDALAKPTALWAKAGHRPPLMFTPGQLQASAHLFPIELLDMRQSRRVLLGDDPLASVNIDRGHLRLQLERELASKLLTLREGYLLSGGKPRQVFHLLTASVAGFLVLCRAALRLFQEEAPAAKTDALAELAKHLPFDPQPLRDADALKHGRRNAKEFDAATLFASYLKTIEQVAEGLGRHLHPQT
jgi:predicted nucleotidyltransferase